MAKNPRTKEEQVETEAEQTPETESPIKPVGEVKHPATGSPEAEAQESETVTMLFPGPVGVNHGGIVHRFKKGLQEVPVFLATGYGKNKDEPHWYLKASGVIKAKSS